MKSFDSLNSSEPLPGHVTALLEAVRNGDEVAKSDLLNVVYVRIREIAGQIATANGHPTTLTPTAICHDAIAKIIKTTDVAAITNRTHLYSTFALTVKHVIIDYARKKNTKKRGGEFARVDLDLVLRHFAEQDLDVVELQDAIASLSRINSRAAEVVDLKFFGGLSVKDVSEVLGVSAAKVEADWRFSKSYLHRVLSGH